MAEKGPAAAAFPGRAGRLPVPVSSFVGRDHELAEVIALLRRARLVTLTGVAGIGKTRLAIEVASRLAHRRPGATWLAELGGDIEPNLVAQVVADALGVPERPGGDPVDGIVEHLGARPAMLVLDNCEHVVGACAELADALLRSCAGLSLLATSQQRLGVTGERVWQVPPLSLPAAGLEKEPASLADSEAVALFCERAVASRGSFTVDAGTAADVAEICRRLDGIPLAIELAAARTQVLSPAQIASHLDTRFGLLTEGGRTTVARHRTLRAALDWSHELLTAGEAVLLGRLSVFAGGASLAALEAVCAGDEVAVGQVFELLSSLVAKSWVVADTSTAEARYRLLETIRHYAAERLADAGEGPAIRARHAAWFLDLAERVEPRLRGVRQRKWLAVLDADHDNLRAAMEWAVASGEAEMALRMAGCLAGFWEDLGHVREGRDHLRAALTLPGPVAPARRAKALRAAGALAAVVGERAAAEEHFQEALRLAREAGDTAGEALALTRLGFLTLLDQEKPAALNLLGEGLAKARASGDATALAAALHARGQAHMFQREPAEAQPCFEECLEVAAAAGDAPWMGDAVGGLAWAASTQGDYEAAEQLLTRALHQVRQVGAPFATAMALAFLAGVARTRGEVARARALVDEALAVARELTSPFLLAHCLAEAGRLALVEGDVDAARGCFDECLLVGARARPATPVLRALLGLGDLALVAGNPGGARARFEAAAARATAAGDRLGRARALFGLGEVARTNGDDAQAASLHHEAIELHHQVGDPAGIVDSLEAVAGLAAAAGHPARAARLWAAAQALRDAPHVRYARPTAQQPAAVAALDALREALGKAKFDAAWRDGSAMSVEEAVALASRGRGTRPPAREGWESLTRAEREVAALVQQGLTNAEIGERLFISARTAQAHLTHIFAKLHLKSRRELAREAVKHQEN